MKWRSVQDDPPPLGFPVVVWSPYSGCQQLFETSREGEKRSWYWMNEYGNGSMPEDFKPQWWAERPKAPPGIIDPAMKSYRFMRRVRSGTIKLRRRFGPRHTVTSTPTLNKGQADE